MEYLEKIFKKTGWNSLIMSVIFAILGMVLIKEPEGTVKVVSYILGAMFIIIGIYKVISYLANKGKYSLYNYDIAYGIIAIILGIVTIAYSSQIGTLFRILIGLWIIYISIIRMNLSFKFKVINSNVWLYSFIIAIAMLVCGMYTIFNSNTIIVTIGVVILVYSVLDIIENIIFLINVKKYYNSLNM